MYVTRDRQLFTGEKKKKKANQPKMENLKNDYTFMENN